MEILYSIHPHFHSPVTKKQVLQERYWNRSLACPCRGVEKSLRSLECKADSWYSHWFSQCRCLTVCPQQSNSPHFLGHYVLVAAPVVLVWEHWFNRQFAGFCGFTVLGLNVLQLTVLFAMAGYPNPVSVFHYLFFWSAYLPVSTLHPFVPLQNSSWVKIFCCYQTSRSAVQCVL